MKPTKENPLWSEDQRGIVMFECRNKKIKHLSYFPQVTISDFDCSYNEIKSLVGSPSSIGDDFLFSGNKLTSLHNIHKHIKHIGNAAFLDGNPITSHVLGLLLIDGLKYVFIDNKDVQKIINKTS